MFRPVQGAKHRFSDVSRISSVGAGRFAADVDTEWTIGGKPNGGYLLALLGRAAVWVGEHDHVIAASAHYLRSPDPGPVDVEAEVLRSGRTASQVRARMSQGSSPCVEALVTTSRLDGSTKPYWSHGVPGGPEVPIDQCELVVPGDIELRVAIMEQVDVRIEPRSAGFMRGEPSGAGELRGWLSLPDGESFDAVSLLYAVDSFPPATLDVEMAGWVPTLEMTAYVRALPAPGPVRILQKAHLIEDGRVDETCFVWDSTGRLVAQGTQLAGIRLA